MFSACQARLLSTFSGIKLELLLHSQMSNENILSWTSRLKTSLEPYKEIQSELFPIIERTLTEEAWVVPEIRMSALSNAVLNYTSATEYYLSDLMQLKLVRFPGLFKRALDLRDISINRMDIVNFTTIEDIKKKYIDQISYDSIRGELWTKKFAGASKIFDVPINRTSPLLRSIDSIWELRNQVAHLNRRDLLPVRLIDLADAELIISDLSDDAAYLKFCIILLEIMGEGVTAIKVWEKSSAKKWDPNFIDFDELDRLDELERIKNEKEGI